jgi:hypothetical protein
VDWTLPAQPQEWPEGKRPLSGWEAVIENVMGEEKSGGYSFGSIVKQQSPEK